MLEQDRQQRRREEEGDRWTYERSLLRYMLSARTADGSPIVCAETLLREFLDEISVRHTGPTNTTTADLRAWAMGESEECTDDPHCLCFMIWQSYRVIVGAWSYGYHPDWLCVAPAPTNGSPEIPAWDSAGSRIV